MSRVTTTTTPGDSASTAEQVRQVLTGRHVCPYCGHQNVGGNDPCPRCTMEDTPATRQATKARIGPWYVLQSRNPAAPGMKFATLLALINKGHVTPRSVLRGPTTHQLWRFAAHVRGVSREFGLCYSCGGAIERGLGICPHCQRSQDPPADPDALIESRNNGHTSAQEMSQAPAGEAPATYSSRMIQLNRQRQQGAASREPAAEAIRERPPVTPVRPSEQARRGDGRIVSAMELAAALQDEPGHSVNGPRRLFRKFVAVLLLLALVGGGALMYLRRDYRDQTVSWLSDTWATVKLKVASIDWPRISTKADPTQTQTDAPKPAPVAVRSSPASASPTPVIPPPPAAAVTPTARPAPETPAPEAPAPVVQAPPQVAPVKPAAPPAPIDTAAAIDQARKLWGDAIDAEGRQDFAGAARTYEQIKKLPSDAWPAGLQLRLDFVQRRVAQSSTQ